MPVLHVLMNLSRDATVAIVLFVESRVQMVDNYAKVALQGVVIDWTLPVTVNAIVYIRDSCLYCPVRDVYSWVLDDLAYDLWFEGPAMSENPVGVIARHCCP